MSSVDEARKVCELYHNAFNYQDLDTIHMRARVEEIAPSLSVSYVGRVANVRLDFKLIYGAQTLYGTDFFNLVWRDGACRITQKIYDVTRAE